MTVDYPACFRARFFWAPKAVLFMASHLAASYKRSHGRTNHYGLELRIQLGVEPLRKAWHPNFPVSSPMSCLILPFNFSQGDDDYFYTVSYYGRDEFSGRLLMSS